MEFSNKNKRCCFTGHRPEKLNITEQEAKKLLCHAIETAINNGYNEFITGMAKGIDVWAGELVLEYQSIYPDIELICALPYPTFYRGRTKDEQSAYHKVLSSAKIVHISFPSYSPLSYQSRNMWMVDNSSLVIAAFTGESGGTKNTVDYAKTEGLKIINILEN